MACSSPGVDPRRTCCVLRADRPVAARDLCPRRRTLEILIHHRDLAPLREESQLEHLSEPERKAWRETWSELNALLPKAG